MLIREFTDDEWPAVWSFMHKIVAAGETFPYELEMTEPEARAMWLVRSPGRTVVAVNDAGALIGTANM